VQSTLAVLLESGFHQRGLKLERIAKFIAGEPSRKFRLAGKGAILPGNDADLTLVDLNAPYTLRSENLMQRHRMSPYVGSTFRGVVRKTIRRGETIFQDGKIVSSSNGKLVRPALG